MSTTPELYVYYKAPRELAERVKQTVAQCPGVRLLLRDDGLTWMEIHSGANAEATEAQLAEAMAGWLPAPRHVERFTSL